MTRTQPTMRRILIFGSVGSGKSTLGTVLGVALGLPVIHLDLIVWQPGCQTIPDDDFFAIHENLIAREAWILDGIGPWETWDERAAACDTIAQPDYSMWQTWRWTLQRQRDSLLGRRPISPPDCPFMSMTWKLLRWTWTYRQDLRPAILKLAERERSRGKTILQRRTPEEMRRFLHGLPRVMLPPGNATAPVAP